MILHNTVYKCDMCGKEYIDKHDHPYDIIDESHINTYTLPGLIVPNNSKDFIGEVHRDLCYDCYKKIFSILYEVGIIFEDNFKASYKNQDQIDKDCKLSINSFNFIPKDYLINYLKDLLSKRSDYYKNKKPLDDEYNKLVIQCDTVFDIIDKYNASIPKHNNDKVEHIYKTGVYEGMRLKSNINKPEEPIAWDGE